MKPMEATRIILVSARQFGELGAGSENFIMGYQLIINGHLKVRHASDVKVCCGIGYYKWPS